MTPSSNTREINSSLNQSGGAVWDRLRSERDEVCEALLKESQNMKRASLAPADKNWHHELLQHRLTKIDDALDRLMSGTYGDCCRCGRWIEDTKLEFDPAIAFCIDCWARQQTAADAPVSTIVEDSPMPRDESSNNSGLTNRSKAGVAVESLSRFDTIKVKTANSEYRIFMLDPRTGRAVIEGGRHFPDPVDATISGSWLNSSFKPGWLETGLCMEFWSKGKVARTSPVQSLDVHRSSEVEAAALFI